MLNIHADMCVCEVCHHTSATTCRAEGCPCCKDKEDETLSSYINDAMLD
jgi:hypothetical protein